MLDFIIKNIGTIAVSAVLAAVLAVIASKAFSDMKKGKCAGCACRGNCGMNENEKCGGD